jgi:hypothetical protein
MMQGPEMAGHHTVNHNDSEYVTENSLGTNKAEIAISTKDGNSFCWPIFECRVTSKRSAPAIVRGPQGHLPELDLDLESRVGNEGRRSRPTCQLNLQQRQSCV